jgi:polyisoprenoid-binding protein YceI
MKKQITVLMMFALTLTLNAQIYTAKPGSTSISFYSEAPLENIEAQSKVATIVLQGTTNDLQARMSIQSFKFKNALMEEHFNENYLESDKYPNCVFKGKINEKVDYEREGETKVTVTGKMELHGVTRDVTMDGTLTKVGNEITLNSKWPMKVADYNIKVPSMYVKNIAEVVDVTFTTVLEPYKKK